MTTGSKKQFERRAGLRFGYLVLQLIEEGWKAVEISEATGIDRSIISLWQQRAANPTLPYDSTRNGLSDQTIQGIHDGLGVRSDFLFMSAKGYPKTVRLRDGAERPTGPDEIDHKLFKVVDLEEARDKRDVAGLKKHAQATDVRFETIEKTLGEILKRLPESDDTKRNAR